MKTIAIALMWGCLFSVRAAYGWDVPTVENVRMLQRVGTRLVDIWYDLDGSEAIVTLGIETNGVAIPDSAVTRLTGDVSMLVQPGQDRHIVWNAGADWPENQTAEATAVVATWSTRSPPHYMVVDLAGGITAASYGLYYYASAEAVPDGVTNNLYKTKRIVLCRLTATGGAGYPMGSPENEVGRDAACEHIHQVVLTQDFYMGVYEVTQEQWQRIMRDRYDWPSYFANNAVRSMCPVESVSYEQIRGTAAQGGAGWPENGDVYAESVIGRLRSKTGLFGFDLPTEAQWEYACRAGSVGALNGGSVNLANITYDSRLDLIARVARNGGKIWSGSAWVDPDRLCASENGTAVVGSFSPNSWGLYDMHGNVWEWCLDRYTNVLGHERVVDPAGDPSAADRVIRGGSWGSDALRVRSASRGRLAPNENQRYYGFRIAMNLP